MLFTCSERYWKRVRPISKVRGAATGRICGRTRPREGVPEASFCGGDQALSWAANNHGADGGMRAYRVGGCKW